MHRKGLKTWGDGTLDQDHGRTRIEEIIGCTITEAHVGFTHTGDSILVLTVKDEAGEQRRLVVHEEGQAGEFSTWIDDQAADVQWDITPNR
jgi:hypothetical protein